MSFNLMRLSNRCQLAFCKNNKSSTGSVDLGEAVHEVDQLQPVGVVDVRLAGATGQYDLVGEVVDLRDFSICGAFRQ